MNSLAELQALTAFLGDPARTMRTAADKAAARIQTDARAGYKAGQSPDKKTWEPRKDGQVAVQRPAATVEFYADDQHIIGLAEDVLKWHVEKRPVFPDELPAEWDKILEEEHNKAFGAVLGKIT
jgi:hypothetical protein